MKRKKMKKEKYYCIFLIKELCNLIWGCCVLDCRVEHWEIACPGGGWRQGCVKFWEMCDGIKHCDDGSDEDPEVITRLLLIDLRWLSGCPP